MNWRKIKKFDRLPDIWMQLRDDYFTPLGMELNEMPRFGYIKRMPIAALCAHYDFMGEMLIVIAFRKSAIKNDDMFFKVFLHEMVHQWQIEHGIDTNHGKEFQHIAKLMLERYNIDINCEGV